jgi:hypothetical protein
MIDKEMCEVRGLHNVVEDENVEKQNGRTEFSGRLEMREK